ncbi:hypothetical protein PG997_010317 [Apiospora hydei]|uniref:Uncharacterized protein n=1 Tax=Apiospora hydei TaxID=1337664 RepID=A0ABR1VWP6_9PEZI
MFSNGEDEGKLRGYKPPYGGFGAEEELPNYCSYCSKGEKFDPKDEKFDPKDATDSPGWSKASELSFEALREFFVPLLFHWSQRGLLEHNDWKVLFRFHEIAVDRLDKVRLEAIKELDYNAEANTRHEKLKVYREFLEFILLELLRIMDVLHNPQDSRIKKPHYSTLKWMEDIPGSGNILKQIDGMGSAGPRHLATISEIP